MKYFKRINNGEILSFQPEGTETFIPEAPGNTNYDNMLEEVEAGTSTIEDLDVTYVKTYADNRIAAYGSIGDQLDMQYHDGVNSTTTWADHVAAVKAANPKE